MKLSQSGKRRRSREASDYPNARHGGSNTDCMSLLEIAGASIEQIQNCAQIIRFIQTKCEGQSINNSNWTSTSRKQNK